MMALEQGIARLVEEFIAAGRPSSRQQNIDDRRAGYVASAVLAGESETRVQVDDITLEGINFRVVSPQNAAGPLPTVIYYHGGCFVSGGFATHDKQLRQLAYESGCRVIAVQYRLAPEQTFPAAHNDAERERRLSGATQSRLGWIPRESPLRAIARGESGSRHRATAESCGDLAARAADSDLSHAGRYRGFGKLHQQRRGLHHHPGYAAERLRNVPARHGICTPGGKPALA